MPAAIVEKVAKELDVPVSEIEKVWDDAKAAAKEQDQEENYAYVMRIFQNMIKGRLNE